MTSIGRVSHFVYEANKMANLPSGTRGGGGNWIPLSVAHFRVVLGCAAPYGDNELRADERYASGNDQNCK